MQLLYVCSDFGIKPRGTKGASIHLRAITRALAEQGHQVLLLSPHESPGYDHPATPVLNRGCPADLQVDKRLRSWLARNSYDDAVAGELRRLLYNSWVHDYAIDALSAAEPDAIIERLSLFGHVGLELAQRLGKPLVLEANAVLTEEASQFRSLQLTSLARTMEQRVLEAADAVIAVSSPLADRIARRGIDRKKIHVVPNGVDSRQFQNRPSREVCRAELGFDGEFVVGFAGSLKKWHGVDDLLTAFRLLKHDDEAAKLLIVGAGPMERELKAMAHALGIAAAVTFTGAVPHERVPLMLRAMDVAVAPFKSAEQFYFSPIKLFEYMAAGTSLIATRQGQISEVIEDGGNGLLCNADDAVDLHRKLRRLRQSADLRSLLASRALGVVRERFTWTRAAVLTTEIVREVLASYPAAGRVIHSPRTGIHEKALS